MKDNQNINMVWHYTRAEFLPSIEGSGNLKPQSEAEIHKLATGKMGEGNVKLLWFSSNQNWEPFTAQLGRGLTSKSTWQELAHYHRAIRFGLNRDDQRLLDWEETCQVGGGNRQERRAREKVAISAKKVGANVYGWFTSLQPIPLNDLHLQVWYRGVWMDYDL